MYSREPRSPAAALCPFGLALAPDRGPGSWPARLWLTVRLFGEEKPQREAGASFHRVLDGGGAAFRHHATLLQETPAGVVTVTDRPRAR